MNYEDIILTVAEEVGLPYKVVDSTYKAFWRFIREKIAELPLRLDLNEEEFEKLRTNFNIPSLGKLTCTFDRMQNVKKRFDYIQKLRNK